MNKISDCLDQSIDELLAADPFAQWSVKRTEVTDIDPPETHYEFPQNGLDLRCDGEGRIDVIFMFIDQGFDSHLFDIPYQWNREQIRAYYGAPEKCSNGGRHPVLGEIAAWDRFRLDAGAVRFEYSVEDMKIKKITLMRSDAIP